MHELRGTWSSSWASNDKLPTAPRGHNGVVEHVGAGPEVEEDGQGQPLREDISELRHGRDVKDSYIAESNPLTHEMKVDLDVLRALMLHGVGGEVHGAHVVAVDDRRSIRRTPKLVQKLAQPTRLGHDIGHGPVFRLRAGPGDGLLPLGGPRDEIVADEDAVARRGLAGVRTTRPVGVRVCDEAVVGGAPEVKAELRCAADVAQDALEDGSAALGDHA